MRWYSPSSGGAWLSQEALAEDAGIDRTYVSRLERNLENPTIGVLERIARAFIARLVISSQLQEQEG